MRILSVKSVKLSLLKSNPPQLMVEADGIVGTPGWKDLGLVPMEKKLSADGILDLEFVGTPPKDPVIQVIRPVTADIVIKNEVEKIVGVLVHARTNKLLELLGGQQGEEGGGAGGGGFKTMAIGEEGGGPTTLALGEEKSPFGEKHPFEKLPIGEKTIHFGEEKPPFGEKTPAFGEEKFPEGEKTPFKGEEKAPFGEKTAFVGEETKKVGETGLGGETEAVGETMFGGETDFVGESGPIGIETDVGIETDTGPVGEDFQDVFRDRIRTPFNRR